MLLIHELDREFGPKICVLNFDKNRVKRLVAITHTETQPQKRKFVFVNPNLFQISKRISLMNRVYVVDVNIAEVQAYVTWLTRLKEDCLNSDANLRRKS